MNRLAGNPTSSPSRLKPLREPTVSPFVRAAAIEDASVYWLPVSQFPMLLQQRDWLLEFHQRLAAHLLTASDLREECFLQFKSLYPDLLDRFTSTSSEYVPMTGASLVPGTQPQPLPDFDAIKQQMESASKSGEPVDVNRWMPDHLHWFLLKKAEAQRRDFFGYGGMLSLYLAKDPGTVAPTFEMPRLIRSHPGYTDTLNDEVAAIYSLRDAFLAKSKEVFGSPFRQSSSYRGLLFVLPLFTGESLVQAMPEDRAAWFAVFEGYFIESKVDHGMLLVLKDPDFDDRLQQLVDGMREDGLVYRA